ncbi:hypothetical protein SESBI_19896 [Sesbania bispinosa]|nr:hypothetical protein SESBI_19896 [Sesbania bispinosa]
MAARTHDVAVLSIKGQLVILSFLDTVLIKGRKGKKGDEERCRLCPYLVAPTKIGKVTKERADEKVTGKGDAREVKLDDKGLVV